MTWMAAGAVRDACRAALDEQKRAGGDVDVERVYRHLRTTPLDPETGQVTGERAHVSFAVAAMRVVAEVDVDLGLSRIVWIGTAQDVGKAINPLAVEGQIEGGTAQGLGLALMEEIRTSDGLITNASFTDYLIPTTLDMPPVETVLIEDPEPDAPYGLKGVGEPPTVVSTAAVVSALRAATRTRADTRSRSPGRHRRRLTPVGNAAQSGRSRADHLRAMSLHIEPLSSLPQLRGLLEVTRLVRDERDLTRLVDGVAATISESLGWSTVAINLYRPAEGDFEVTTVHGNEGAREALLGTTRPADAWTPLLAERFLRRGAYLIPHDEAVWGDLPTHIPDLSISLDPNAWHPEDASSSRCGVPTARCSASCPLTSPSLAFGPRTRSSTCSSPSPSM